MTGPIVNTAALERLYAPWEQPNAHRVRAQREGAPAEIKQGRRASTIAIVQNLRQAVAEWREAQYAGVSDTSRELLVHWFDRDHLVKAPDGPPVPFRYFFCQREAIETLIYLMEVRRLTSLAGVTEEFGGADRETAALGIDPAEDIWPRFCFKIATGAGKTKVMSLAIVWSYFHALRESDSPMARHFVAIAPNLTVFERLKVDFGDGRIFDADPLIPPGWRGDWNLSVVLQDEATGAATGGTLYLTNIHRLYDPKKRGSKEPEMYRFMGPPVSRAKALDTGEALRERITSHEDVMILNDEAHHLWDPGSAWSEAVNYLDSRLRERFGRGLAAQLDFSATPKDNQGQLFKHIIVEAPLGEAVDGGIVKTPVIGRGQQLTERAHDDAAYRYEAHLTLGYQRWLESKKEWEKSGKKALMFVMTENTNAADQIAGRLNTDPLFAELNGKTINLHTNLKGKLKRVGRGANATYEFVESESEISDEDLRELRKLSRELDENTSPYRCIVSVLMLREGWDVRNVTTIVPLRPYSAPANILPEQTLGRGLRRMVPSGDVAEVVSVVEHPAFASLYRQELAQEGLPIEIVDVEHIPRTTVTIYPDGEHKDLDALDIQIPRLTSAHHIVPKLEDMTFEDVKAAFARFTPLPLGQMGLTEIDYVGKHLFTGEVVERMKVKLPLLESGVGALSFYREMLEHVTKIRGTHKVLAPLIQRFLEEVLFDQKVDLSDPRLLARLSDDDVQEHIRATFVPLIRAKTTHTKERRPEAEPQSVCAWKPFQATHSEQHPCVAASKTPFNLVPCNQQLEVGMTAFLDSAPDVAAFCKNAGPQALRIDYLGSSNQLAFYAPDFLVRKTDGQYLLVETKGLRDADAPAKARAAVEWCKSASAGKLRWDYLYVPADVFERTTGNTVAELCLACAPALVDLVEEEETPQLRLAFEKAAETAKAAGVEAFIDLALLEQLPSRYRGAIEDASRLLQFSESTEARSFSPVFQPLLGPLDEAAKALIIGRLQDAVPVSAPNQHAFFNPSFGALTGKDRNYYGKQAGNLRRTLVFRNGISPIGLLAFCLEHARRGKGLGGVFAAVRERFADLARTDLCSAVQTINEFRNTRVAHGETPVNDPAEARAKLKEWVSGLCSIWQARH